MKKVVVKLDLHDDKAKQKAMKSVSSIPGIDSVAMDMKDKKLTVIGNIDPIDVVTKLKKRWCCAELLSVGPAKEPEKKKEEPRKEEPKKEEPKKVEPKKEGERKEQVEQLAAFVRAYEAYHPHCTRCCHAVSIEEDPNACVIC